MPPHGVPGDQALQDVVSAAVKDLMRAKEAARIEAEEAAKTLSEAPPSTAQSLTGGAPTLRSVFGECTN